VPAFLLPAGKTRLREIELEEIGPNDSITYSFHQSELKRIDELMNEPHAAGEVDNIDIELERVQFDQDTVWSNGEILHPDPRNPQIWIPEKEVASSKAQSTFLQAVYKSSGLEIHGQGSPNTTERTEIDRVLSAGVTKNRMEECYSSSNTEEFPCLSWSCDICKDSDQHLLSTFGSYYQDFVTTWCICDLGGTCANHPYYKYVKVLNPQCIV
jgi:hypothetical protein